jgi:hypothetical protein
MLELIPDLSAGVVGVEAKGKVEDTDYSDILVPASEKVRVEHGKVRFLRVLGDDWPVCGSGVLVCVADREGVSAG